MRRVQESFWFLPSLILAGSIGLAVALIAADSSGPWPWMARFPRLFGAGAEGARGMLSTIAGSMMTVVGVTFSMTLVVLALASSQYTSRILRNFMRDRATQIVIGVFAGIFVYCLIVLRTIRSGDEGAFVPSLAVMVAVVLAVGGISVLIFFIHHIAFSIQASNIAARVAAETIAAVERLFPQNLGHDTDDEPEDLTGIVPELEWHVVAASDTGYIANVDTAELLGVARDFECVVRMERGIGGFVVRDTPLASLGSRHVPTRDAVSRLRVAYEIRHHRTVEQDFGFGIRQLVDVALRALSPGINDTTTAVMCVDHLSAILACLATRAMPNSHRYEGGALRVIAVAPTFAGAVDDSFDQIRASASGNAGIMLRMLDAIRVVGGLTWSATRRRSLRNHVRLIDEAAVRTLESPHDRKRVSERVNAVVAALEATR